eukprot:TRINITY_DN51111_c0_g1_i1.p1 TRINITY_DN51111_c0_g1~~TRINITY_DN51111_c0_g1_i1.p1  ORF type:complete len:281 (+),score=44.41 TRINITY_DN51111_c0_g1_i1:69-845(+)
MAFTADICNKLVGTFLGAASQKQQILLLGLDGAGKSTLMYRLKFAQTQVADDDVPSKDAESRTSSKDPPNLYKDFIGYIYEEFQMLDNCGIWDLPGDRTMRFLWATIYQSIQVHCIWFVIDGMETKEERVHEAEAELRTLMYAEELQRSPIAIIVNWRTSGRSGALCPLEISVAQNNTDGLDITQIGKQRANEWWLHRLGLHHMAEYEWRYRIHFVNCDGIVGENDPKLDDLEDWMKVTLGKKESFELSYKSGFFEGL